MLETLDRLPPDPILGLMAAYRADGNARKVDLGVGVYRDDHGDTPVLRAIRQAEQGLLAAQTTKSYVSASGNPGFNQWMERLLLGEEHIALSAGRVRTIQAPGGCGALRLGAELIAAARPTTVVFVPIPTWANHIPLLSGCGLKLARYAYFNAQTGAVAFSDLLTSLEALPEGSVVLLHSSCHNPTGADLSEQQWQELLPLFRRRQLLPFIDVAYQGLGTGVTEDVFGVRLFCAELPEVLVAASCSKNFGIYRERTGSLSVIGQTSQAAEAALSQLVRIARMLYSMPPDHGAELVHRILADAALREVWTDELASMRNRIQGLRHQLVAQLARECPERDFGFIASQHGMFSHLGIDKDQVGALRAQHHVYLTEDSRINIAGLRADNIGYFAQAVAAVLRA